MPQWHRVTLAFLLAILLLVEAAWAQGQVYLPERGQQPSEPFLMGQEPLSPGIPKKINKHNIKEGTKAKVAKGSTMSLKSKGDTFGPYYGKYGGANSQRMDSNIRNSRGDLTRNNYSQSSSFGSKSSFDGNLLRNALHDDGRGGLIGNGYNQSSSFGSKSFLDGNLLRDALREDGRKKARKEIRAKDSLPPRGGNAF
jgi:hypothetical protein